MSDLSIPEDNASAEVAQASSQRGFALPEPIAHREGLFGAGIDSSTSGFSGLVSDSFLPGEASRPYGGWFDQVVDVLEELIVADGLKVADVIEKVTVDREQLGVFNNYAVVQGCDHIVPVDVYLPGCPPRPEALIHAVLVLREQIGKEPLGVHRREIARCAEQAALEATPTHQMKGLLA